EHFPKIFDPYFTTKQKGSGLGLAISYSIIKKHDGYITVESELGTGTTFRIYLPASERKKPLENQVGRELIEGRGKVLIMDDEESVRNTAGKLLTHIGYEVEFARDGSEAIELYRQAKESNEPFDIVIMDLTIPGGVGGKEAIWQLLEMDPDVKAIVSSGYSNDPIMSDPRQYGFSGVIAKPYEIEDLSKVLHRVVS
ncbi:MAG: response regulator, partial [Chloroflexota bacterium]|nr:response regulator [Chloroflexota bacterium]